MKQSIRRFLCAALALLLIIGVAPRNPHTLPEEHSQLEALAAEVDFDAAPALPSEEPASQAAPAEEPAPPASTDAPVEETPDASAEVTPDASAGVTPDAPAEATPDVPVEATPDAPAEETPIAPVEETPDAPVEETPTAPAEELPEETPVPEPESIALNPESITIGLGETVEGALSCRFFPEGSASALSWTSSNTRYVKVDRDSGAIKGMRAGSATITATTANGLRASCKVKVAKAPSKITLSGTKLLGVGDMTTLSVGFSSGAHSHALTYAVDTDAVVRLEGNRLLAVAPGTAKVTATTFNKKTASLTVTVVPAPESVTFSTEAPVLGVGQSYALSASVNEGSAGAITFLGDNDAVAQVSPDGEVRALSVGSVNVTATAYNGISAAQTITVLPEPREILLSGDAVTICVGEKIARPVEISVDNGMTGGLRFKSSNTRYVKVDEGGHLTGMRAGSATVTVTAYNGVTAHYKVKVVKAPSKITLSGAKLLGVGDTSILKITANSGAGVGQYSLTSNNPEIIAIDGLTLRAVAPGTAKVTATTFNKKTASLTVTVVPAPERVTFSDAAPVLGVGQSYALSASVNESSAGVITFLGDNAAVAEISPDGVVRALGVGSVNVTATAYNGISATQTIRVLPEPQEILLSDDAVTICVGEKIARPVEISVDNGMTGGLRFKSSNTRYVKVDEGGHLTGIRAGSATVTVTAYNGVTAHYKVKVVKAPSKITLSGTKLLGVGDTSILKITANSGAGVGQYSLTSNNPEIIAIDGLTLRAVAPGTAKVTATTFNKKTASLTVTVVPAPESVTFSAEAPVLGVGQSYALSASVNEGSAGSITFSGDNDAVAQVSPDGEVRALSVGSVNVTATAYNGISATQTISVLPAPEKIYIAEGPIYLGLGEVLDGALELRFDEGCAGSVQYKSSNTRYVKVDASGRLTGQRVGSATVTATAHNGASASCRVVVQKAPSKVSLKVPMPTFSVGQAQLADVTVTGRGHWELTSSDPGVVAVEEGGLLRAVGAGQATVTARTYNGKTGKVNLTVVPAPTEIFPAEATASVGEGMTLRAEFFVNEGSFATYRYAVSDPEIASVDADGVVTGLRRGRTRIIATTHNGLSAEMELEVLPAPDAIRFEAEALTIGLGEVRPLEFHAEPEGAVGFYTYATGNAKIANIRADGKLTGVALGSTQITVTAQNGTFATLDVTVVPYGDVNPTYCMAHRGASGYFPDNSIAAFRYAAELGAQMVELDVRKTLDGQLVVFHDSTILVNGKKQPITKLTMAAIRRANPDVCTLNEALDCIAEVGLEVMVEFKVSGIEAEVLEAVDARSLEDKAKYGSFNLGVINKIKELRPSSETIYIMNSKSTLNSVLKDPNKFSASTISVKSSILNSSAIYKLHLAGKSVVAWTLNTRDEIQRFMNMGVDGITTNYPDYM